MSDRLTVVFDDPDLYRRLKVRAAEEGVAMKRIIERALSAYLGDEAAGGEAAPAGLKAIDWAGWDRLQAEIDALPEEPSPDASDVKHQLYGYPRRRLSSEGWRIAAEEPFEYDARPPE